MPNVVSPTERWFINLEKLQGCVMDLNHLTASDLKQFSKQTLGSLITSDLMKGQLGLCCQNKGIGIVPNGVFGDMTKNFFFFLETVSNISLKASLRSQILSVAVKHKPELITKPSSTVMKMSLDDVFGNQPLNSNIGKKELDLLLNQITPDEFYPTDGSLFSNGSKSLNTLVNKITE
jgi:hypothetical protein